MAVFSEDARGVPPNVAEPLYYRSAFFRKSDLGAERVKNIKSSQSGGRASAFRAAVFNGLAGKRRLGLVAGNFFKFVAHPGHYLRRSVYIRRRYIFMRAQDIGELTDPSAGEL